jgi:peroxiredoxin
MEAYRDQYATLFNNGQDVVVLGISVDPDTTLVAWSKGSSFPVVFVSDADAKISRAYQTYNETNKMDARHLYVIDKSGKITYKTAFRVMAADAYTELDAEVDKVAPPKPKEGSS